MVGTKTTHGDPKELDEAKGASSTVDLSVKVSIADQVNDKEATLGKTCCYSLYLGKKQQN